MKVYKIRKIDDMAIQRRDAIDRCISLGEKFIEHFHKIYKNPNDINVNHWMGEMQGWLDTVKRIRLKESKDFILDGDLYDWFYTAGSSPDVIVPEMYYDELKIYDKFAMKCLNNNDVRNSIREVIKK